MDARTARRLLGVAPGAEEAAVRHAYRRLARKHHPDAGGDPATFVQIQHAYDVLRAWPPGEAARRSEAAGDPDLEARYQALQREAEQRSAHARRLAREATRNARSAHGEEAQEAEDSFTNILHDAVAQAGWQLGTLLERAQLGEERGASATFTAGERALRRLKTLIDPPQPPMAPPSAPGQPRARRVRPSPRDAM